MKVVCCSQWKMVAGYMRWLTEFGLVEEMSADCTYLVADSWHEVDLEK
jgi:hypothetical protein